MTVCGERIFGRDLLTNTHLFLDDRFWHAWLHCTGWVKVIDCHAVGRGRRLSCGSTLKRRRFNDFHVAVAVVTSTTCYKNILISLRGATYQWNNLCIKRPTTLNDFPMHRIIFFSDLFRQTPLCLVYGCACDLSRTLFLRKIYLLCLALAYKIA